MIESTTVLLTGANRGLGLVFLRRLLSDGHRVFAACRKPKEAKDLILLKGDYPTTLEIIQLDISNRDHVAAAYENISKKTNKKLDVLINNAGYGLRGGVADFDPGQLEKQFTINTVAPVNLMGQFSKILTNGVVINISSIASYFGLPYFGAYSASKAALNVLSFSFAVENYKSHNISTVVIQPGPYESEFNESAIFSDSHRRNAKGIELNRKKGDPEEISTLISKLIKQKLANRLPAYKEIPIGRHANLFRLCSRWLPHRILMMIMERELKKTVHDELSKK